MSLFFRGRSEHRLLNRTPPGDGLTKRFDDDARDTVDLREYGCHETLTFECIHDPENDFKKMNQFHKKYDVNSMFQHCGQFYREKITREIDYNCSRTEDEAANE